ALRSKRRFPLSDGAIPARFGPPASTARTARVLRPMYDAFFTTKLEEPIHPMCRRVRQDRTKAKTLCADSRIRIRRMYLPHPVGPGSKRVDAVGIEVLHLLRMKIREAVLNAPGLFVWPTGYERVE